jgi:hypothetical protein
MDLRSLCDHHTGEWGGQFGQELLRTEQCVPLLFAAHETCRVAKDIVILDDDVADIDAHAKFGRSLRSGFAQFQLNSGPTMPRDYPE